MGQEGCQGACPTKSEKISKPPGRPEKDSRKEISRD